MNKKIIVFLSDMAFDANCSIVNRLKDKYDVYFMSICREGVTDRMGDILLNADIVSAKTIGAFSKLSTFLDLEKTYLIRHYSKAEMGWNSFVKKVQVDIKILHFLKNLNPDVVLVDSPNFPITRLNYRTKIISIVHDPFPHTGERTLYRRFQEMTLKLMAKRFLLFNESQKQQFIDYYGIQEKDVFTSFLSQYEFLNIFAKDNLPTKKSSRNILFWGRISPYKGIDYLIDGFIDYLEKSKDNEATLTIAGAGNYHFDVDERVKGCKQIEVIKRFLSMAELADKINECTFVICPYTDATQSGVIMSAYAFKKPVCATNVGGLPEMLGDGKLGMLIQPKSKVAITDAIFELLNNESTLTIYENEIDKEYFNGGSKSWGKAVSIIEEAIDSL